MSEQSNRITSYNQKLSPKFWDQILMTNENFYQGSRHSTNLILVKQIKLKKKNDDDNKITVDQ